MESLATGHQQQAPADRTIEGFLGWLPRWSTDGFMGYRHDQWYAVATEFCISGMGETPEEAQRDLKRLVDSYLRSSYEQGRSFKEARRPVGTIAKLRLLLPLKHRRRLVLTPDPG